MAADRFSSAEVALFGPQPSVAAPPPEARAPQGRVLRSLIEPPPPAVEVPEPPRRGRKPGSKNRPKAVAVAGAEMPRPALAALSPEARAFAERPAAPQPSTPDAPSTEPVPPQASEARIADAPTAREIPRLRERSSIIKRYVLGVEPRPGQAGFRKSRRASRATA